MLTHTFCAVPFCFGLWAVCTLLVPVPTFKALYITWHSCYYLFIFQFLLKIIRVISCDVQLFQRPVAADDGVTPCILVCAKLAAGKKSEVVLEKKKKKNVKKQRGTSCAEVYLEFCCMQYLSLLFSDGWNELWSNGNLRFAVLTWLAERFVSCRKIWKR